MTNQQILNDTPLPTSSELSPQRCVSQGLSDFIPRKLQASHTNKPSNRPVLLLSMCSDIPAGHGLGPSYDLPARAIHFFTHSFVRHTTNLMNGITIMANLCPRGLSLRGWLMGPVRAIPQAEKGRVTVYLQGQGLSWGCTLEQM